MTSTKGVASTKTNSFHHKPWLPLKGMASIESNGFYKEGIVSTKTNSFESVFSQACSHSSFWLSNKQITQF